MRSRTWPTGRTAINCGRRHALRRSIIPEFANMNKIQPATKQEQSALNDAIAHLKNARDSATMAKAPRAVAKIKSALQSADGARRHMERRLMHTPQS